MKIKILLINTGGTIACEDTGAGYSPLSPDTLSGRLSALIPSDVSVDVTVPYFIDSIDSKPEHWQTLAGLIYDNYDKYAAFLITHGTDTMQYTAAALHFMLQNLGKPVVLTGSQLPLFNESTDGFRNFEDALRLCLNGGSGVILAFGGRVMNGLSTYKFHSTDFDAFRGNMSENTVPKASLVLKDRLCTDVFLLKLTPNVKPTFIKYLGESGYKGIVLEGFGLGGIPEVLHYELSVLAKNGVRLLYVTSCPEGGANLNVYSVSESAKKMGVEDGKDLTPSAAVIKLMSELAELFDPVFF